ncbi:uncharacterized protein F4812DRAFT_454772 [Daldinia caldariorum]|uniref:uncharacterized protein n=1 Tax=Daldinia caldariorum TaxID=326644 RepID=UPI00200893DA|nr:uncharacterized protein F4812DRAFT_454772 [Daldinia caldariorum]KAI1472954.1 hypothetical protein F4812DRAFT_454772 [Daldinia caldariorum]
MWPNWERKVVPITPLMKFLDPADNTPENVFIDNKPLNRIYRTALRQHPYEVLTPADAEGVIKLVGLRTFVRDRGGLKAGLVTKALSQGQRQLFSLAWAILRRRVRARSIGLGGGGTERGILLLDEVSSSVDRDTKKLMQEIISNEFSEYTVVAVCHHLDIIMDY